MAKEGLPKLCENTDGNAERNNINNYKDMPKKNISPDMIIKYYSALKLYGNVYKKLLISKM